MRRTLSTGKGIVLCFCIVAISCTLLFLPAAQAADVKPIYSVTINNLIITPNVEDYIIKAIGTAEREAQCLIIFLNTPGGLLRSTRNIVSAIMNSKVPIVVYVSPGGANADSSGFFITLAAHIAVMAPSTRIGAANPVKISGSEGNVSKFTRLITDRLRLDGAIVDDGDTFVKASEIAASSDRLVGDTAAWAESIARARGRNVAWAGTAVSESASATETEAFANGVIDLIAYNSDNLLELLDKRTATLGGSKVELNTRDAELLTIDMTQRQRFFNILSNPTIAFVMLILGFYGLLFEFTNPGLSFPGIIGSILLLLGFYGLHTLPTNYPGTVLILVAVVLFMAESRVATYGIFTLFGIVCLFLGAVILIHSPHGFLRISLKVILPLVMATGFITLLLTGTVSRRRSGQVGKSGRHPLIGKEARVIEAFDDDAAVWKLGKVFVRDEIWAAQSKEVLQKDEVVDVTNVDGSVLTVRKKEW